MACCFVTSALARCNPARPCAACAVRAAHVSAKRSGTPAAARGRSARPAGRPKIIGPRENKPAPLQRNGSWWEMLKETERALGVRLDGRDRLGSTRMAPPKTDAPSLSDLGVSRKEFRVLASVPRPTCPQAGRSASPTLRPAGRKTLRRPFTGTKGRNGRATLAYDRRSSSTPPTPVSAAPLSACPLAPPGGPRRPDPMRPHTQGSHPRRKKRTCAPGKAGRRRGSILPAVSGLRDTAHGAATGGARGTFQLTSSGLSGYSDDLPSLRPV